VAETRPAPGAHRPRPVRWGIVGTGGIPAAFAADLRIDPETGDETLSITETLDRARAVIGLRDPGREAA
jgi:hypothetical protein